MTKWSDIFVKTVPTRAYNPPVGTVVQSILSLAQFQAEMGDLSWVLMDGSNIAGSTLSGLTGNVLLPDATGRFLRTAGGDAAALGTIQPQATAVNGLTNEPSAVTGTTSINHTHSPVTSDPISANHTHTATHNHPAQGSTGVSANHVHNISGGNWMFRISFTTYVQTGGTGWDFNTATPTMGGVTSDHGHTTDLPNLGVTTGTVSSNHTHLVSIPALSTAGVALSGGSAAAQNQTGDTETRPTNVTVNTFIKIN